MAEMAEMLAPSTGQLPMSAVAKAMPASVEPNSVFDLALRSYPYLADKGIAYTNTPNAKDTRMLESWLPNVQGWEWQGKWYERPFDIPMDAFGVQNISAKTRPIDILADYVSHYGVENDPALKEKYERFTQSLDDKKMRERYKYHTEKMGEDREYDKWLPETGVPELFRGYTFDQFGKNAKSYYTPKQLKILDEVRSYLGVGGGK